MKEDLLTVEQAKVASAIVAELAKGHATAEEVFAAFEQLDGLSPEVVRAAFREWTRANAKNANSPEDDTDDDEIPKSIDNPTRLRLGLPEMPLRLHTLAMVRDADVLDLGPIVEQQLRIAGRMWDGLDLAAEERLDGENEEVTFAGTLEHHVLADRDDASNAPLYDVLLYAGDSGVIFRAGTTTLLGTISYGVVEMKERRIRNAIESALRAPPPPPPPPATEEAPPSEAPPSEAPPSEAPPTKKKSTAKKKSADSPTKRASTKKTTTTAKKTATAKKTTTKKTTAKKTATKKATTKKTTAKS